MRLSIDVTEHVYVEETLAVLAVVVVGYTLAAVAVGVVSWVGARQGTAGPWRAGLWAVWLGCVLARDADRVWGVAGASSPSSGTVACGPIGPKVDRVVVPG